MRCQKCHKPYIPDAAGMNPVALEYEWVGQNELGEEVRIPEDVFVHEHCAQEIKAELQAKKTKKEKDAFVFHILKGLSAAVLVLMILSFMVGYAFGQDFPSFSCKAYGRMVECSAQSIGGHAIKWEAATEKEPSYFAYGSRVNPKFAFQISTRELTTIYLYVDGLDEPLTAYAKWDGKKVWFSERRKDL